MITITEKRSFPIEIAAPSTKSTILFVYLPTSLSRTCCHPAVAALLDVDRPEAVRVQPELEPVDVPVGVGLAGSSIDARKVGVEPVCGRLRLIDDDGGDSPDGDDQRSRTTEVHDRDREAAPDSEPPELDRADRLDERIEQQREERRDQEEEDDVKDASRDHPRQDQQERKPDQLHPARDLDLRRRAGGHRGDRTAPGVRLRAGPATDGALARDPDDWWSQESLVRLKGRPSLATVTRMQPATAYRRPQRRPSRAVRRARHRAILLLVGLGVLVILAVAAFRPDGRPAVGASAPAGAARLLPPPPPNGLVIASADGAPDLDAGERVGRHRDRLPRRGRRRASRSTRSAGRRTRASPRACSTASSAGAGAESPTTCSAAARAPRPERSTSAPRRARTCTRPWTAPSSLSATTS